MTGAGGRRVVRGAGGIGVRSRPTPIAPGGTEGPTVASRWLMQWHGGISLSQDRHDGSRDPDEHGEQGTERAIHDRRGCTSKRIPRTWDRARSRLLLDLRSHSRRWLSSLGTRLATERRRSPGQPGWVIVRTEAPSRLSGATLSAQARAGTSRWDLWLTRQLMVRRRGSVPSEANAPARDRGQSAAAEYSPLPSPPEASSPRVGRPPAWRPDKPRSPSLTDWGSGSPGAEATGWDERAGPRSFAPRFARPPGRRTGVSMALTGARAHRVVPAAGGRGRAAPSTPIAPEGPNVPGCTRGLVQGHGEDLLIAQHGAPSVSLELGSHCEPIRPGAWADDRAGASPKTPHANNAAPTQARPRACRSPAQPRQDRTFRHTPPPSSKGLPSRASSQALR